MLFHQRHGRSLRVATKFSRLTRAFFSEHGIVEYSLVGSSGATEGAPAAGVADFVVDLTSTGTTLAENHLKEITGGTVLETAGLPDRLVPRAAVEQSGAGRAGAPGRADRGAHARHGTAHSALFHSAESASGEKATDREVWMRSELVERQPRPGEVRRTRLSSSPTASAPSCTASSNFSNPAGATGIIVERGEFIFEGSSPAFDAFKRALKGRGRRRQDRSRGRPLEARRQAPYAVKRVVRRNRSKRAREEQHACWRQRPANCYLNGLQNRKLGNGGSVIPPARSAQSALAARIFGFHRQDARDARTAHRQAVRKSTPPTASSGWRRRASSSPTRSANSCPIRIARMRACSRSRTMTASGWCCATI